MGSIIFEEGEFCLRLMEDTSEDYALVSQWLSDPRVLEFYEGRDHPFSLEDARQKYGPRILSTEGVTPCIIEYECRPIGYLQFYQAEAAEYQFEGRGKVYALDLYIGIPEYWGRGLGPSFIRLMLCYLFEQQGTDWVIIDPRVENVRAIRAYEKCGFRKIKILPKHELHEGKYDDCWLMGIRWDQQQDLD